LLWVKEQREKRKEEQNSVALSKGAKNGTLLLWVKEQREKRKEEWNSVALSKGAKKKKKRCEMMACELRRRRSKLWRRRSELRELWRRRSAVMHAEVSRMWSHWSKPDCDGCKPEKWEKEKNKWTMTNKPQ
jgi:hypothetical protein